MKHVVQKSKLNKDKSHREAMLRTLAAQVIQYESITTTGAKAKAVLPLVDKMINAGKRNDLIGRRQLYATLYDELAIKKVLDVLSSRFKDRVSGYTSIVKLGKRSGDRAEMVKVLLLEK